VLFRRISNFILTIRSVILTGQNSYFISRSWDLAINDYSMSLDLKPANSDVWLNKGIALLNSGKVDDACHDFESPSGREINGLQ
jgi:lipoprotein NlpI